MGDLSVIPCLGLASQGGPDNHTLGEEEEAGSESHDYTGKMWATGVTVPPIQGPWAREMLLPANLQGDLLEPERGSQNPQAEHKQSWDLGTGDQRFPGPRSPGLLHHFCILPCPSSLCFSSFLYMWVRHGCPSLSVKSLPISRSQREF